MPRRPGNDNMWRFIVNRSFGICLLLAIHAGLLAYGAVVHSPTIDEVGHFPAGLGVWRHGRFDLYCVNPPLVRAVATLPVHLAVDLDIPWTPRGDHPVRRPEFPIGRKLIELNAPDVFWWFTVARWACIPFSLLAGVIIYRWARHLYGTLGGFMGLALWCFDPMVLGHAQLITPDAGAAAFGVFASYTFWKWLKEPTWTDAFLAGVVLGLAELCKTSWIILFPLWLALWVICRSTTLRAYSWRGRLREASQVSLLLALGVYVVNLGYAFDGTFVRLGDFEFTSAALKGETGNFYGNRFHDTWLGDLPVPLPRYYVMGIDIQKRDFEGPFLSYLAGEWRDEGWWHRYFYGLAVKMPLGTLLLILASMVLPLFRRSLFAPWRDELVLLAPAVGLFAFVSSQNGMNHHVRYVLPTIPFLFIGCARLAGFFSVQGKRPLP